ncbi:MAG: hypothetical protein J5633_04650 [Oscillospiraceae bacterium]|nr:hypothetical protein [Oscillospiraceae bacterium]
MNEAAKLESYKKKLEGVCDANELQYRLSLDTYPISMTISPLGGMDAQISMLEAADENTPCNSVDAKIVFSFYDGELRYKFYERFAISDNLVSKLRNLFRNIHNTFLELFHRQVVERDLLRSPFTLPSPETDSNERITEPLEEYEPEEGQSAGDSADFPEDFMDEEPEDPEDPGAMTIDEYLLKRATDYVRREGRVNLNMLCGEFNISYSKAGTLIEALTDAGVISEQTGLGGMREILPYEGEADG